MSRVVTIAWAREEGRCRDLARVLDGTAVVINPGGLWGSRVWLRYPYSAVVTLAALLRHRPKVVVAQNPPVFPALLALLFLTLRRGRLVLDSHPASFGSKANRQARLMLPVTRFLARRAAGVLVTAPEYVATLESWGARGLIIHEPPLAAGLAPTPRADAGGAPVVFFASVFAPDEPTLEVVEAARRLPDARFVVTGRIERCPVPPADLPANVELTDYIALPEFLERMAASDIVLSLTDDPTSVARSGYEATYLRRPLVISDVASMVENFPLAVPAENSADSLVEAIVRLIELPLAAEHLARAEELQRARWAEQEAALRELAAR